MASKAFLKALRKKHHLGEFSSKHKNTRSVVMAKKRRFSAVRRSVRKFRRSSVKSSNIKTLGLMGVGAGLGRTASIVVRQKVPQLNSVPSVLGLDLVELGLGYLAYKYGHKLPGGKFLSPIGAGMMVDSIGGAVGTVAGSYMGSSGSTTSGIALY